MVGEVREERLERRAATEGSERFKVKYAQVSDMGFSTYGDISNVFIAIRMQQVKFLFGSVLHSRSGSQERGAIETYRAL